ncbi:hypothetical protein SALBM311S_00923 [Streptomyces alboniger]
MTTGAADYLTKPFDPWVLRAKVTVFLDLHRKNRQSGAVAGGQQGLRGVEPSPAFGQEGNDRRLQRIAAPGARSRSRA